MQLFARAGESLRYEIEEGPLCGRLEVNGKGWQMYDDTVIGFDEKDREIVRLSVVEPLHERSTERPNSI